MRSQRCGTGAVLTWEASLAQLLQPGAKHRRGSQLQEQRDTGDPIPAPAKAPVDIGKIINTKGVEIRLCEQSRIDTPT